MNGWQGDITINLGRMLQRSEIGERFRGASLKTYAETRVFFFLHTRTVSVLSF